MPSGNRARIVPYIRPYVTDKNFQQYIYFVNYLIVWNFIFSCKCVHNVCIVTYNLSTCVLIFGFINEVGPLSCLNSKPHFL